ncbi:hypothetical protein [Nonomuraea recticatena]|uniref:Uncharacterized protein n=1 Tax=Nonomuraea recticatena TaxID=46178 RepID=A0ABP6FSK9_9ACTN
MAMTLPQEHAWLASVTGASAVFLWNEDALNSLTTHLNAFLNQATPGVYETNAAGARHATAITGPAADAFNQHLNNLIAPHTTSTSTGSGDTGGSADPLQIAAMVAGLLGLAAAGVVLVKTGVLARLAWCAQQMVASAAAGPGGALTTAQAIATTRTANTATAHQLLKYLTERIAPHLRRASDALPHGRRYPVLDVPGGRYGPRDLDRPPDFGLFRAESRRRTDPATVEARAREIAAETKRLNENLREINEAIDEAAKSDKWQDAGTLRDRWHAKRNELELWKSLDPETGRSRLADDV